jgi:hypothetical protein
MQEREASRTVEYMALFRALESAQPPRRRLFEDRCARLFLRPRLRTVAGLARLPLVGRLVPTLIDRAWPGARSSGMRGDEFYHVAAVHVPERAVGAVFVGQARIPVHNAA